MAFFQKEVGGGGGGGAASPAGVLAMLKNIPYGPRIVPHVTTGIPYAAPSIVPKLTLALSPFAALLPGLFGTPDQQGSPAGAAPPSGPPPTPIVGPGGAPPPGLLQMLMGSGMGSGAPNPSYSDAPPGGMPGPSPYLAYQQQVMAALESAYGQQVGGINDAWGGVGDEIAAIPYNGPGQVQGLAPFQGMGSKGAAVAEEGAAARGVMDAITSGGNALLDNYDDRAGDYQKITATMPAQYAEAAKYAATKDYLTQSADAMLALTMAQMQSDQQMQMFQAQQAASGDTGQAQLLGGLMELVGAGASPEQMMGFLAAGSQAFGVPPNALGAYMPLIGSAAGTGGFDSEDQAIMGQQLAEALDAQGLGGYIPGSGGQTGSLDVGAAMAQVRAANWGEYSQNPQEFDMILRNIAEQLVPGNYFKPSLLS